MVNDLTENKIYTDLKKAAEDRNVWQRTIKKTVE